MGVYLLKRFLYMIIVLVLVSFVSFIVIQLPPGDYLTSYMMQLRAQGTSVSEAQMESLRVQYGLDRPITYRYVRWISNFLRGDMGTSFAWNRPVSALIRERIGFTIALSVMSLIFVWIVSFIAGVYSAVRQYSVGDYIVSFFAFIGMAVPGFLMALILMFVSFRYLNISIGGLFSPQFRDAPWSIARAIDLLKHLWIPVVITGIGGTAGLVRILRANLLDELKKPYVTAAKAKGLPFWKVLVKYPVRLALNPFISTVGWILPGLLGGGEIVAIVLNLPTLGQLMLSALLAQDMYFAGSVLMILSFLTVIGTLISDLLLVAVDPRIRYERLGR
jgi:peptide/nickel transport system permease protein